MAPAEAILRRGGQRERSGDFLNSDNCHLFPVFVRVTAARSVRERVSPALFTFSLCQACWTDWKLNCVHFGTEGPSSAY